MHALQQMFPSLTLFSDLNWEAVTQEYETHYIDLSFPEYLQHKADEGDCPPYLFELAFLEMAKHEVKTREETYPHQRGIYLNPTALFLSLEFDVKRMLDEAQSGTIAVHERSHVLCVFKDTHDKVRSLELSEEELILLQHLENGLQPNADFVDASLQESFKTLTSRGLILQVGS